jgi:hypothetical protein
VGRVARQFHDAVTQVRTLRKQVKEIQETLGAGSNVTSGKDGTTTTAAAASAMSLRELWLKKLEAEAVLSLLEKLDRIRAAPLQFDSYLQHYRIGAAVITVAQALDTMFSSDVAQVQALHKIMEQLMMRKQKAEEVVWELLMDVLFLRTGNGQAQVLAFGSPTVQVKTKSSATTTNGGGASVKHDAASVVSTESKPAKGAAAAANTNTEYLLQHQNDYRHHGMTNPFLNKRMRFALEYDLQVEKVEDFKVDDSTQELEDDFYDDDENNNHTANGNTMASGSSDNTNKSPPMILPSTMMDAEFDLEADERRSLEEQSMLFQKQKQANRPTYVDHVLALRTLVECLVRLRRMDDVERIVTDCLERELSALVQREQARTFLQVESSSTQQLRKSGRYAMLLSKAGATTDLRDFRRHLGAILSAFGNVQVRLTHLSQIIRHRIVSTSCFWKRSFFLILTFSVLFVPTFLLDHRQDVFRRLLHSVLRAVQCLKQRQKHYGTGTQGFCEFLFARIHRKGTRIQYQCLDQCQWTISYHCRGRKKQVQKEWPRKWTLFTGNH